MGVGELGQIIGETGVGETGVGEMGVNRIKQGVCTVDSLHLKLNRYMMPIILATVTC